MFKVSTTFFATALAIAPMMAFAGPTTAVEGISNDIDVHERSPILTFGKAVFSDSSRILVDALERNNQYTHYPIRFDFYINGNLMLSQFRSKELPIPVGITLGKKEYPLPYNFTLVATLVTPNRTFTTTAYGVMDNSDFAVTLPCTLSVTGTDGTPTDYRADTVALGTGSNGALSLSFTGTSESNSTEDISASLTVTDTQVTGSLTLVDSEKQTSSVEVNGTVTLSEGNLTTMSVSNSDATTTLSCG